MNPLIEQFVSSKRIAIVGMSRSGKKFGNMAAYELKLKGYKIYPIHPEAAVIDGLTCAPNLRSIKGEIDAVLISISPQKVSQVLNEIAEIGLNNIWLQQGAWSKDVQKTIDRLKLPVITKKCIMMYIQPVKSVHEFHRRIKAFFGRL